MNTWSFANITTGVFLAKHWSGPDAMLANNTPDGFMAVSGAFDCQRQKVDVLNGMTVAYQPPKPADTDLSTWQWDVVQECWREIPTLAAGKATRIAEVQAAISAVESQQSRPQGDIVVAMLAGATPASADVFTLLGIRTKCSELRAVIQKMAESSTKELLEAIIWKA